MKPQNIFPCVLIALNVGAGVMAAAAGAVRKAIYWTAAAVLNAAVTF